MQRLDNFHSMSSESKIDLIKAMMHVGSLENVIREACENKGSMLWNSLQEMLFKLNTTLMSTGFSLGSEAAELEWKIRNIIENTETSLQQKAALPSDLSDPMEMLEWVKDRIHHHRVSDHELFDLFDNDELSDEEIRYFLSNYRVNMQRFHLHVAAYSLFVPFEMREELYENLHDEFGQGDFDQAHPNLFEPLMEFFGGAREEDWNPETYHLLNTKINLCWFADGIHYGLGGMGALELTIPAQQRRILANLRRRGLDEELVRFFVVHCEVDQSHGDGWFAAGLPYLKTRDDFERVYAAAIRMLDARAGVYDGILKGIRRRRKSHNTGMLAHEEARLLEITA